MADSLGHLVSVCMHRRVPRGEYNYSDLVTSNPSARWLVIEPILLCVLNAQSIDQGTLDHVQKAMGIQGIWIVDVDTFTQQKCHIVGCPGALPATGQFDIPK
jgi:hypothetical protein